MITEIRKRIRSARRDLQGSLTFIEKRYGEPEYQDAYQMIELAMHDAWLALQEVEKMALAEGVQVKSIHMPGAPRQVIN